jgi:hypothetical protein
MPFKEATFWWGTIVGGTGIYFWANGGDRVTIGIILTVVGVLMSAYAVAANHYTQLPKLQLWLTAFMVTGIVLTYDIYDRHYGLTGASRLWYVALLILTVVFGVGSNLYDRYKNAHAPVTQNESDVNVSLVPWKGKGPKMFLTVTNLSPQRQAFQGQCRILARRNDLNTPQLITFDLQWEYGGQSYTLGRGQAGNLLIASANHSEHREREWLQLESATGTTKPQRSDWNWGDKPPEYDVEITILSDGAPYREKFTVRGGKECAIEMGELGAAPKEALIEKPQKKIETRDSFGELRRSR